MLKRLTLIACLFVMGCGSQAVSAEYNIQVRRDTAARWASFNPVLKAGELACEQSAAPPYNCTSIKVGNGTQAWSSLPYIVQPPKTFRGALVYSTPATVDIPTPMPWSAEAYDTDNIHSVGTDPERLTVPAGVTKVRIIAQIRGSNTANTGIASGSAYVAKNNTTAYPGAVFGYVNNTDNQYDQLTSPVMSVQAGDYFELRGYNLKADAIGDSDWFAMEIIE